MFESISAAISRMEIEHTGTKRILAALTDDALAVSVEDGHRTLGRMAWHIVTCYPEMMGKVGCPFQSVNETDPIPASAVDILTAYERVTDELIRHVREHWTDETLRMEDNLYGENWKRGNTLLILLLHEAHHRGQMTVLMRQAGLTVPGIYGPALEEWQKHGMQAPEI